MGDDDLVFVLEAEDLDLAEHDLPGEGLPVADVVWPDGRVDRLPHTSLDNDLDVDELIADQQLVLHFGYHNHDGMPVAYFAADIARLSEDAFYSRAGEDDPWRHYLRGPLVDVLAQWVDRIVDSQLLPLHWPALMLASHYGLLHAVPTYEDNGYGASLFELDPGNDWTGLIVDTTNRLSDVDRLALVNRWEADGITWPRAVAEATDTAASNAWAQRVEAWTRWLDEE